jgi:hypothetical protein
VLASLHGSADAIVELVGVDFQACVHGSPYGTLLHHAAWVGDPRLVELLLGAERIPTHTPAARSTLRSRRRRSDRRPTSSRGATTSV